MFVLSFLFAVVAHMGSAQQKPVNYVMGDSAGNKTKLTLTLYHTIPTFNDPI